MLLLRWIFTALAIYWVYQNLLRPLLVEAFRQPENPREPNVKFKNEPTAKPKKYEGMDDDYIDYEEIK